MNIWEFIRQPISKRIGNIPSAKGWFWDTGKVSDNYDMGTTSADFERAYKDEVWVQRCINLIASCVASVPIKLYEFKGDKKTEIKDHPILRLLDDVNPLTMNASDLWMATVINRKVYGNAYWYIERKGGAEPKELYSLRPPNIEIVPEIGVGKYIKTFDYTTGNPDVPKIQYTPHDIIHFKHFNPESEYYGLSPLASVREAISADLYAQAWNKNFFKNAGRPDGFFTNKEYLTEDQKKLMQKAIDATYKGVSKVGKVGILEGGWEYKQVSVVPKDAEWQQLRVACREAICSSLGVPPVLVVAFEAATYACLPYDERIFTPNGSKKIGELSAGDKIWLPSPNPGIKEGTVKAQRYSGDAEVFELNFRWRKVRASGNHPILVVGREKGINPAYPMKNYLEWKPVSKLNTEDIAVIITELPDGGKNGISKEYAELAGYWLAEGTTEDRQIRFSVRDYTSEYDYYSHLADGLFSYERNYKDKQFRVRRSWNCFTVGSRTAADEFRRKGLSGRALTKRIPDWIFSLSKELKLAFLRGYLDGDGSVSQDGRIVFASPNKELIEDLWMLVISCGIPTSNVGVNDHIAKLPDGTERPQTLYRLAMSDAISNRSIGAYCDYKKERLENGSSHSYGSGEYWNNARNLNLPHGFGLARLQSKKSLGIMPVYDLQIEEAPYFVANGVVVHNTAIEQKKSFWHETCIPELHYYAEVMNWNLLPQFKNTQGMKLEFDLTNVPALLDETSQIYDRLFRATGVPFLTVNEARNFLAMSEVDGGDAMYIPLNMIEAGGSEEG